LGSGNVWIGVFHYWEILENNAEMSTNPCLVQLRSWAHLPEWVPRFEPQNVVLSFNFFKYRTIPNSM